MPAKVLARLASRSHRPSEMMMVIIEYETSDSGIARRSMNGTTPTVVPRLRRPAKARQHVIHAGPRRESNKRLLPPRSDERPQRPGQDAPDARAGRRVRHHDGTGQR